MSRRGWITVTLVMGVMLGTQAWGQSPGGLFEQRLRAAERKASPPARPAARPTQARSTAATPSTRAARSAQTRHAHKVAAAPVRTTRRPPRTAAVSKPVPRPPVRTATAGTRWTVRTVRRVTTIERDPRAPASSGPVRITRRTTEEVRQEYAPPTERRRVRRAVGHATYSIAPRADHASSPMLTGDIVLFTTPAGVPVRYTWEGGSQTAIRTTVLKGMLPQTLHIVAEPEGGFGRAEAWVPIKAGCITTVRFSFRD